MRLPMNIKRRMWGWASITCLATLSACGGGGGGGGPPPVPGTVQFEDTEFDVNEGAVVNIRVARSGGSSGVVSVDYATMDGTAVAGLDYGAVSGTLTWADGLSGNQTISIAIADDSAAEATESFTLVLSNPSRATLGPNSSATIDIIDNDSAAVSVLGPISALNRVTVNGIRYDTSATNVMFNGQPAQVSDLELGQTIAVQGDVNFSNGTGAATEIDYSSTVIGPVESIDAELKHLIVMGQTVLTNAETALDASIDPDTFAGFDVGANAEISGFRNAAGEIVATRLAPATSSTVVQLAGTVSQLDLGNMLFTVGRLTVDYGNAVLIDLPDGAPANGESVLVRGSLRDGILVVSEIASGLNVTTEPGARSLLNGVVTRFASSSDFDLNGFPVTTADSTNFINGEVSDLEANVEITIDGEVTAAGDGVFANEITFGRLVSDRTTQNFDFANFTNLSVSGFANLEVIQGPEFLVEVTANSDLIGNVEVTQTGDTITIDQSPGSSNTQVRDALVTMPVLNRIDIAAGSLANVVVRDFDQTQMEVNVDGVSLLRGKALRIGELTATVSGVSVLDFGNIRPIGNASIDISGVSQATLNMDVGTTISGSVTTGQGTGESTLFYFGTNVTTNVATDSVSRVVRLGDTKP